MAEVTKRLKNVVMARANGADAVVKSHLTLTPIGRP